MVDVEWSLSDRLDSASDAFVYPRVKVLMGCLQVGPISSLTSF